MRSIEKLKVTTCRIGGGSSNSEIKGFDKNPGI